MRKFLKKVAGTVKKAVKKVGGAAKKVVKSPVAKTLATAGIASKIGGKLAGPAGKMAGLGVGAIAGRKMFGRRKSSAAAGFGKLKDPHRQLQNPFGVVEKGEDDSEGVRLPAIAGRVFKKGGPVKRAAGSPPKGETRPSVYEQKKLKGMESSLDEELEAFGKRARSGELGPGKKKSDLPLVDQYEVDRKMGRFSGSFKEYMDSKEAKQFKHGGVAMKHSDKTGRAMKKTDADAKGRAMPKAKGKMAGGMMTKGMMAGGMMTKGMMAGGMATKGYAAGGAAMPMVMKDGKKMPAFAADGKGKMAKGGMAGGMAKGGMAGGMSKVAAGKATRGYGAARRGS